MKNISPYKRLEKELQFYKDECSILTLRLEEQEKRIALLNRITSGPPTVLIACEKIVEAAAQVATSAVSVMRGQGKC